MKSQYIIYHTYGLNATIEKVKEKCSTRKETKMTVPTARFCTACGTTMAGVMSRSCQTSRVVLFVVSNDTIELNITNIPSVQPPSQI
jgi:hypothetical protein